MVLNWGEMWKQRVEHNLLMLTLLSGYILHRSRVGRMAGVSKEFVASVFRVVQEYQDTNFFETSAIRPSAHFAEPNKWPTMTLKCHANLQSVIIQYNPNKEVTQFLYHSLFTLIHVQHVAAPIIGDIYIYIYIYIYVNTLPHSIVTRMKLQYKSYSDYIHKCTVGFSRCNSSLVTRM